jgi:hypothetical protein
MHNIRGIALLEKGKRQGKIASRADWALDTQTQCFLSCEGAVDAAELLSKRPVRVDVFVKDLCQTSFSARPGTSQ